MDCKYLFSFFNCTHEGQGNQDTEQVFPNKDVNSDQKNSNRRTARSQIYKQRKPDNANNNQTNDQKVKNKMSDPTNDITLKKGFSG